MFKQTVTLISLTCLLSQLSGSSNPDMTSKEWTAYTRLTGKIQGKVAYTRDRKRIHVMTLGETDPVDIGPGFFVRWSPDGTKLAVMDKDNKLGKIYVMDAEKNAQKIALVADADFNANVPLDFHSNGREILYFKNKVMMAVDIETKAKRQVTDGPVGNGEPGISRDGTRVVCRDDHHMLAIDLTAGTVFEWEENACSPCISPDGAIVLNNYGQLGTPEGHIKLFVYEFGTKKLINVLNRSEMEPDTLWDNHHWSNHDDWFACQGQDGPGDTYIVQYSTNDIIRASWVGDTWYPDLWVDLNANTAVQQNRQESGRPILRTHSSRGMLNIEVAEQQHYQLRIYNILGRLTHSANGNGPQLHAIRIEQSGCYIVVLEIANKITTQKTMVIR